MLHVSGIQPGDNATLLGSNAAAAGLALTTDGAGWTMWGIPVPPPPLYEEIVVGAPKSVFNLPWTFTVGTDDVIVFWNGQLMSILNGDYTETGIAQITMTIPIPVSDLFSARRTLLPALAQPLYEEIVAGAPKSVFNLPFFYTVGAADVAVSYQGLENNLSTGDYTESGAAQITMAVPIPVGDIFSARRALAPIPPPPLYVATPAVPTTVFILSFFYAVGTNAISVKLNGQLLSILNGDYVENNITTITLATPITFGDVLKVRRLV